MKRFFLSALLCVATMAMFAGSGAAVNDAILYEYGSTKIVLQQGSPVFYQIPLAKDGVYNPMLTVNLTLPAGDIEEMGVNATVMLFNEGHRDVAADAIMSETKSFKLREGVNHDFSTSMIAMFPETMYDAILEIEVTSVQLKATATVTPEVALGNLSNASDQTIEANIVENRVANLNNNEGASCGDGAAQFNWGGTGNYIAATDGKWFFVDMKGAKAMGRSITINVDDQSNASNAVSVDVRTVCGGASAYKMSKTLSAGASLSKTLKYGLYSSMEDTMYVLVKAEGAVIVSIEIDPMEEPVVVKECDGDRFELFDVTLPDQERVIGANDTFKVSIPALKAQLPLLRLINGNGQAIKFKAKVAIDDCSFAGAQDTTLTIAANDELSKKVSAKMFNLISASAEYAYITLEGDGFGSLTLKLTNAVPTPVVPDYIIKTNAYGFATFSYEEKVELPAGLDCYLAKVEGDLVLVNKLTGTVLPANTGILVHGTPNTEFAGFISEESAMMLETGNELKAQGYTANGTLYVLKGNGFYDYAYSVVPGNRAAFDIVEAPGAPKRVLRIAAGSHNATEMVEVEGADKARLVLENNRVVILNNGKRFDVLGKKF